jgi:hypothetical protein
LIFGSLFALECGLLFSAKWAIFSAISWREHATLDEMMMMSALY